MIHLFTVAAPAGSGTRWYSQLLTTDRSYCFHELMTVLRPYPSNIALDRRLVHDAYDFDFEQLQRRTLLQSYPEYFVRLWERERHGQFVVGNSDNSIVQYLPGLFLLWPEMKFLLSIRNGIQVVQSIHSMHARPNALAEDERRIRPAYRDAADDFEGSCRWWAEQVETLDRSRAWLRERGAEVDETSLERITSDPHELERVWTWLVGEWPTYAERSLELMREPANARTNGSRVVGWEHVWESWNTAQRTTFARVCGETQERLGYPLPAAGGPRRFVAKMYR